MPLFLQKNLRRFRERKGWTQGNLARLSGVTKDHISKMERGLQSNPRHETIAALAKVLGIKPGDLLYAKSSPISHATCAPDVATESLVSVTGISRASRNGFFAKSGTPARPARERVAVPRELVTRHPLAYGIRLEDDAMLPALKPGAVVIAVPKSPVRPGDLAVIAFHSGKLLVKEVRFAPQGIILLNSHNPSFAPTLTRRRDIRFLHKVVLIVPG